MDNLTESDKVNKLYSCYGILADCPPHEISQKEDTYKHILMAVNGGEKEKRLACQFIPVFFKYFPGLADMALDALFDLCEDTDVAIRRQAIKELAIFCRDCVRYTKKVTMTLSQLLLVKDPTELRIVHAALLSLFSIDTKAAIIGLFAQIRFGDDAIKDTCLRFLSLKMGDICDEVMKNGGEELLMRKIMATLREATLEDIPLLLKIALSTRRARSIEGRQELGLALLSLLESEGPFDPSNNERIQRLIIYLKHMHLLYSAGESLGCYKIVFYITEEVLPHFLAISGCEEGIGYALEILQLLAEITNYTDKIPHSEKAVSHVWKLLMEFLPERSYEDKVNLNLSYIEYLLFTLHRIIKFCPAVIDKDAEKLKRLRFRLKHVALVVLGYCSHFGTNVDDKNTEASRDRARKRKWSLISNDPNSESSSDSSPLKTVRWKEASEWNPVEKPNGSPIGDSKRKHLREVASDVCSNIIKLTSDFFQDPVECTATVELSSLLERS